MAIKSYKLTLDNKCHSKQLKQLIITSLYEEQIIYGVGLMWCEQEHMELFVLEVIRTKHELLFTKWQMEVKIYGTKSQIIQ